jgi:hypothetical protein
MLFKKRVITGKTRISPVYINISNNPQKSSATYISIKLKNEEFKAIVDSGAEVTLINAALAKRLKLRVTKMNDNIQYIAANSGVIHHKGFTILDVAIGQWKTKQKAIVVDHLTADILLGTDWLSQHGVIINYEKKLLSCGKFFSNLTTSKIQTSHCICTTRAITIPPLSSHIEWFNVPESINGLSYFENENPVRYLDIRDGLFDINQNAVPVVLVNKHNFEVVVGKGKFIGKIEQLEKKNILNIATSTKEKNKLNSKLINIARNLSSKESQRLNLLIDSYDKIFSQNEHDLGFYDKTQFDIKTIDETPIKSRPYRVPYAQQETVNKMVDDMLTHKIISKSESPWASPVVIIKKKDGSNRFCVGYRKLNAITIKDNYPIPLIEETLDTLKGAKYFTSLDLASGYWQIALNKLAKQKTAFITQKGLFQFEVLPFGLSNAVSAFQRTIEVVLEGVSNVKVYLDDILIFSNDFTSHLTHIENVFKKLEEANLKLKPSKCEFAKLKTKFLGFDITSEGIKPCQQKTSAMVNYTRPTNPKQVKRFLGMASYYRKFIPQFSAKAEPINRLLKKEERFQWSEECEDGFKQIINALTHPPVLIYPDFSKEFVLETDASTVGLGAVLAQKDRNGINRPVAYGSRMLKCAEKNYSATELEALAVVWACEQFRPYLYGRDFTIECDHNPLVFIDNMKNKTSRVSRWRYNLSEYRYKIVYVKGSKNLKADALSRAEICSINSSPIINELIEAQHNDKDLKLLIQSPTKGYFIENNVLYKASNERQRIVIPEIMRETILKLCHDDMSGGHLGFKKTWPKISSRYFWKNMYTDTEKWIKSCTNCAKRKTPTNITKVDLNPINGAIYPFEMLGVDILCGLPETGAKNKYILVFTDYLTRWAEAFPLKKMDAKSIAKLFIDEIVCRYSAPNTLLSDQGAQFMSTLLRNICDYLKTKKINTTAYHPQCNGLTERFNATLCQILSMYIKNNQTDWDEYLKTALFAYNTSKQETTLLSPFEILNGRQPRLPSDLENIRSEKDSYTLDFKKKWKRARERIEFVNNARKQKFRQLYKEKIIEIGDSVRLDAPATKLGIKAKIRGDLWSGPFKVIGKLPNGNLKLNIKKSKPYIVHPDRVKPAEILFPNWPKEIKKIKPAKRVSFSDNLIDIIAELHPLEQKKIFLPKHVHFSI